MLNGGGLNASEKHALGSPTNQIKPLRNPSLGLKLPNEYDPKSVLYMLRFIKKRLQI